MGGGDGGVVQRLLVQEMQRMGRDPFLADRLKDTLERGDGEVFRTMELEKLLERVPLRPLERLVIASVFVTSSRPDLSSSAAQIVHADLENAVLALVARPSFDTTDMSLSQAAKLLANLLSDPPPDAPVLDPSERVALLTAAQAKYGPDLAPVLRTVFPTLSLPPGTSLVQTLLQLGPDITSDHETVRALLARFGITDQNPPRDAQVVEIISTLVRCAAEGKPLCDVGALVRALSSFPTPIHWATAVLAFDRLDRPGVDTATLKLLIAILLNSPRDVPDVPHAVTGFWASWTNPLWQLRLLDALLSLPNDTFNFVTLPGRRIVTVDDVAGASPTIKALAANVQSHTWNELMLIETLTRLGDEGTPDVQAYVREMMDKAVKISAELVYMGLLQVSKPWNRTQQEYSSKLLTMFLNGHPNHQLVFMRIWQIEPTYLTKAFGEYYADNALNITRILDVAQDLKILDSLLDVRPFEFALDVAALASRREYLNLDKWLADNITTHGPEFVHAVIAFLESKVKGEIARNASGSDQPPESRTMPLNPQTIAIFIRVLKNSGTALTPEDAEYFIEIRNQCLQLHPRLMNLTPGSDAEPGVAVVSFSPEVEQEVENIYKEMYEDKISIDQMVQLLQQSKASSKPRDHEVFACTLHTLFDEYRFFARYYPARELQMTGYLFGSLIKYQLVDYIPLGIAIRYVLDAVRAPPDSNMFTFGVNALTQFKNRLWEWKPLCHALLGIPHLQEVRPDLVDAARKGLAAEGPEPEEQEKEPDELEVVAFTALRPDTLTESDALVEPPEDVSDKIMFIVNNLAPSNFEAKLDEMKAKFGTEHSRWFARYLVDQRVSLEANNQGLYMRLLEGLVQEPDQEQGSGLEKAPLGRYVLHETYVRAAQLLNAEKTISSSSERRVLKNLASWLGQLTLARNKPILHRNLSFKDLLLEGFDTDRLIVAIPFICAILEQCSRSRIFRPPNPWLMAVLALLAEFYHFAELKLNLKFEIEVLCKALDIDLDKVEAAGILRARVSAQGMGADSGLPDFVQEGDTFGFEQSGTTTSGGPAQQPADAVQSLGGAGGGMTAQIEAIVANLGAMVVVSPAVGYANHPGFKRAVQVAIEGAVREIILPVVDRSVTIASISTKELVAKDYALEADEIKIRKAAQQMVQNLAGSLALVTCKEPLKNNMALHMRQVLTEVGFSELMVPEQIILRVVSDNVDMACTAIERAAMDRAVTVIDETFAASYELRRRHSESRPNQPFWDPNMPVMHYQQSLPDPLRIKPTGLVNSQTRVYDDFSQPRRVEQKRVLMPRTVSYNRQDMMSGPNVNTGAPGNFNNPSPAPSTQSQGPGPAIGIQQPQMTQAVMPERVMERFVSLINELESLFLMASAQHGGEALQSSQEIRIYIRQVLYLAQQSTDREETALAFSQKIVQLLYKSTTPLAREVYVVILGRLCEQSGKVAKEATDWLLYAEDDRKLNVPVTTTLLQSRLIGLREQDQQLAKLIQRDMRPIVMEFTAKLIRECVSGDGEHAFATRGDFPHSLDALSRAAQANKAPEEALRLLEEFQGVARGGSHSSTPSRSSATYSNTQLVLLSERLAVHFDDWVRIFQRSPSSEKAFANYVMQLTNEGILKGEDISSFFFRVCTETSVEQWTKYTTAGDYGTAYQPIDALSRLIVLMIKYNGDATDLPAKVHYLTKILSIVVLVLAQAHESSVEFPQQKPFFRFFSSLLNDINGLEAHLPLFPLLVAICDTFNTLQPINFPGFAFSWMTLISHRLFMPKMLSSENREGWRPYHRLLISLFRFLEPFLRNGELQNPTRTLFHGSLRLFMVLLHDFPEFLSEFYFSLCDVIPARCIQLRNIILSAYPPTLRLPDPHRETQLESLSDMGPIPPVLSDFTLGLRHGDMRAALDQCLLGRGSSALVTSLKENLMTQPASPNATTGDHYNIQALNALVMYVGVSSVAQAKARNGSHVFVSTDPGVTLLTHLANELDTEGIYHLLVSMVTHLRYPNAHTHWFSSLLLHMFVEVKNSRLQEVAARVLLERLMVFRPHPWGALVTFIELLRNPRYDFWNKDFVRVAPEISMLLDRHGPDGLSDISTTHPEFNVRDPSVLSEVIEESETAAEDAIIELLSESPEDSVTVVAVGPLTNIARVWVKNPTALRRARRIVVMGGALDVPGNTSATAEFNFFADPQSAAMIMDAAKSESINLLLAPLDITTQHGIPYTHLIHPNLLSGPLVNGSELLQTMTPLRAFTSAFLYRVRRVTRELGIPDVFDMHDPLAVWAGLVHATLPRNAPLLEGWGVEKRDFVIECAGQYTKGMCVVDRRGTTDETGGVRSIDGVQGVDKAKTKPALGVKVLTSTPGLRALDTGTAPLPSTATPLHKIIHGSIRAKGPISVAQYMQMCLSHPVEGYYMKGEPIGAQGDFVTSPEISQLFGEDDVADVYTLLVAHEFFDAVPIHIIKTGQKTPGGFQEILVDIDRTAQILSDSPPSLVNNPSLLANNSPAKPQSPGFRYVLSGQSSPLARTLGESSARFSQVPEGHRIEVSPSSWAIVRGVGDLIGKGGGAGLVIDYGDDRAFGASFRGFHKHKLVDVFHQPGFCDLTANVDFAYLKEALKFTSTTSHGPITQHAFLAKMGAPIRLHRLLQGAKDDETRERLKKGAARLIDLAGMGGQYKVMGITSGEKQEQVYPFGYDSSERQTKQA
ncbi:CCR4-NOT core subunit cdc39 [Rhizoctonia solani]